MALTPDRQQAQVVCIVPPVSQFSACCCSRQLLVLVSLQFMTHIWCADLPLLLLLLFRPFAPSSGPTGPRPTCTGHWTGTHSQAAGAQVLPQSALTAVVQRSSPDQHMMSWAVCGIVKGTASRSTTETVADCSCRWGNSRSPAYGTLSDYQFMRRHQSSEKRKKEAREAWGDSVASEQDVVDVFVKYCKVGLWPWEGGGWGRVHVLQGGLGPKRGVHVVLTDCCVLAMSADCGVAFVELLPGILGPLGGLPSRTWWTCCQQALQGGQPMVVWGRVLIL